MRPDLYKCTYSISTRMELDCLVIYVLRLVVTELAEVNRFTQQQTPKDRIGINRLNNQPYFYLYLISVLVPQTIPDEFFRYPLVSVYLCQYHRI